MSLRARLLVGMTVIAIVLVGASIVVTRTTEQRLVDQIDAQLADAEVPRFFGGRGPGGPGGSDGPDGPDRVSSLYAGYITNQDTIVEVARPNISGDDTPLPVITVGEAREAYESGEPLTVGSNDSDLRYRVLVGSTRFQDSEVVTVLALPLGDVDETVDRLITLELVIVIAILAVLAVVTWWVIRLGVRPVKEMTAAASSIAAGDLSHRVPEADPATEAGELGLALNQMLGRIEEAFDERARAAERLRQFVADASHELRTPVTTIRGYAELYRRGALPAGGELDEAMRRTEQEAVRMGSLVDDLLHLARLDQGRPLELGPVDLAAVVRDAARDARAVDPERVVEATVDAGSDTADGDGDGDGLGSGGAAGPRASIVVAGDEPRLRQVVANLVANALVHTPPGTPIDVRVGRDDGSAVLEVADHGEGMAPEVAARAFERFYRADPSRSRHRGGSGLGLSIVQATVAAHGGDVSLHSVVGEGTTVTVRLPVADPG